MSILDEAYQALQTAGEPLHVQEIARRMLANGWQTRSNDPTMVANSRLAGDVQHRGRASRFVRTSPGMFALNPSPAEVPSRRPPSNHGTAMATTDRSEGDETLSFSDAAEQILRESGTREPMHYETITELALDQGLIRTEALTPSATMYSVIYAEIRRGDARGEVPRFTMYGKGMVGLAAWVPRGLAGEIEAHNRAVRAELLERIQAAAPAAFEELVGELLAALGFEDVEVTSVAGDGGIDVRGVLVVGEVVRIRMAVQAKRWKGNVQAPVVQQVRGSVGAHEQGLIITTSDFSSGAKTEATRPDAVPVALMNGEQLAALLAEHEIGVSRERHELFSLDEVEEPEEARA